MQMIPVFEALLPVFLVIVAGTLLARTLMTEEAHWIGLERLTYYVLFPALIIETLATADLGKVPALGVGGALFGAIMVMTGLLIALRPMLVRALAIDGPAYTSLFQGSTRWNTFVALGVAGSLYGQLGVALASVAMVAMIPVLNVINVWILARHAAARPVALKGLMMAMAKNPLIWSCVVGIVLHLLQPPIPKPVHGFADMLGRASVALGLLLVGAGLRVEELYRPRAVTLVTTGLKLALMPALAIGLGVAFGLSGASLAVVAACSSVPSASNAYILARQMGGDAPLLAQILTLQTIVAVATMPVIIALVD